MKNKVEPCEVLVAGAGISGIAAALASSRCRAKTVLIEKNSFPGGLAIDCRHHCICGLYPKNTGIPAEIIRALQKLSPKNKFTRIGKLPVFQFKPEHLKQILHRLIRREKNLKVFYCATVNKIIGSNTSIRMVKATQGPHKTRLTFSPNKVIDATGNGSLIKLSKAQYTLAPEKSRQLAGFTFQIRKIKDTSDLLPIKIPYYLTQAVMENKLPAYFKFTNFEYGPAKNCGSIKINLPAKNAYRGEQETKKQTYLAWRYLRKVLPEFKTACIHGISGRIHERQGLCLRGKHTLSKKEVLEAKKFPQAAAKGFWPVEFWDPHRGQKITYLKNHAYYEIPMNCLKSRDKTNLWATGKCISAAPAALASSRGMGTCLYLGQAAGQAAAK